MARYQFFHVRTHPKKFCQNLGTPSTKGVYNRGYLFYYEVTNSYFVLRSLSSYYELCQGCKKWGGKSVEMSYQYQYTILIRSWMKILIRTRLKILIRTKIYILLRTKIKILLRTRLKLWIRTRLKICNTHTLDWVKFSVMKETLEVQMSARTSVCLSITKTPKQHKINHFTLPPPSTPHTSSHTSSHTPSHTVSYIQSYTT